ncbi:WhiB family transcriptional regulator, redox-sensing transcriptional regulator [Actinobaculum suis]|uniref:Transcriptional regulator WhiB n=1 Tax=Actinobaculum suis TaxID=1657 RepID=A0A0K9ERR5_9ACTO|nr:WhiB family transcriptional regulator [Actinobaculum suis]KMY22556.1 WhiB family transcriptional regulator [Actinobaculum suis]MDY5154098.1 WhiB family transcriptional regulator [Actinobaculum suis]OCA93840.1 WhiB family transcriptional regulator [Actinobaculum suis]OCA95817.1 WhiB family transcriptional regulator [Actinobaculum suis]SDE50206.1 WhiB family transcriptional regulator, redox-sensing transcriptional regulator [Actinobaculum suis]
MDWRVRAACLKEDPELFFPVGSSASALAQAERAKAVCSRCTVREQCLDYALASCQDSGVWGGATEDERKALRRRRSRQLRAAAAAAHA